STSSEQQKDALSSGIGFSLFQLNSNLSSFIPFQIYEGVSFQTGPAMFAIPGHYLPSVSFSGNSTSSKCDTNTLRNWLVRNRQGAVLDAELTTLPQLGGESKRTCGKVFHFPKYKKCEKFWNSVMVQRRQNGVKPSMPIATERDDILGAMGKMP
ncbi:hypothetical protein DBR06_SOUSAS7710071, partial [Sousa chinensis]